ncbi:MAG: SDR family oxidoreductase [Bryobacteraceae bacterium]|nr:SDR family oxidoreductase [Bryobacteraceae bacterium]
MERVLVAGAAGLLGRRVLSELGERGYRRRALCRNAARARDIESEEIVSGDLLSPAAAEEAVRDIDMVFSCVGQTVSADLSIRGPGYRAVDIPANLNLLEAAKRAGVRRFVYVSVLRAEEFPDCAYLDAHAQVARAVRESGLSYGILEPTGFFSAFRALLEMAAKDQAVVFGSGAARSNPIADEDLAKVCAEAIASRENLRVEAGGPEILTRREITERAFRAIGKPARVRTVPLTLPRVMAKISRWPAPRVADLMEFLDVLSANDFVAPARGEGKLGDYLAERHHQGATSLPAPAWR